MRGRDARLRRRGGSVQLGSDGAGGRVERLGRTSDGALRVYRRGLSLREAARSSLSRFLPGAILGVGSVVALADAPGPGEWRLAVAVTLAGAGILTAGFASGLEVLRRWLYPDAKIAGRRSFIAGLLAPAAVFSVGALLDPGLSVLGTLGALIGVSVGMAFLMFFAWLTPTPEELRDEDYLEPDELSELLFRSWPVPGRPGHHDGDEEPPRAHPAIGRSQGAQGPLIRE